MFLLSNSLFFYSVLDFFLSDSLYMCVCVFLLVHHLPVRSLEFHFFSLLIIFFFTISLSLSVCVCVCVCAWHHVFQTRLQYFLLQLCFFLIMFCARRVQFENWNKPILLRPDFFLVLFDNFLFGQLNHCPFGQPGQPFFERVHFPVLSCLLSTKIP